MRIWVNWSGSGQEPVGETCIDDNEILDPLILASDEGLLFNRVN